MSPGDGFNSHETPKFLDKAEEALMYLEPHLKKLRPDGLLADLLAEYGKGHSFFSQVVQKAWYVRAESGMETLEAKIARITPIDGVELKERESFGAKYKPVVKKVNPVSTWDPESIVLTYQLIEIGRLNKLPV